MSLLQVLVYLQHGIDSSIHYKWLVVKSISKLWLGVILIDYYVILIWPILKNPYQPANVLVTILIVFCNAPPDIPHHPEHPMWHDIWMTPYVYIMCYVTLHLCFQSWVCWGLTGPDVSGSQCGSCLRTDLSSWIRSSVLVPDLWLCCGTLAAESEFSSSH